MFEILKFNCIKNIPKTQEVEAPPEPEDEAETATVDKIQGHRDHHGPAPCGERPREDHGKLDVVFPCGHVLLTVFVAVNHHTQAGDELLDTINIQNTLSNIIYHLCIIIVNNSHSKHT